MATQIADASVTFSSGESAPELSKLDVTRLALAQEQKKRIDAAVARVTGKKEGGKRKNLSSPDSSHRSKKSKTVVDVGNDKAEKQNSIARRMVDRFSSMPEPEREEEAEQETTRSMSTPQLVAPFTMAPCPSDTISREATEKRCATSKLKMADKETEKKLDAEVATCLTDGDKDDEEKEKEEEKGEKIDWDGPTTNYHIKQLGLDDQVDIYAPFVQQQHDVQRVRERIKYMPSGESTKISSDLEADSDFAQKNVLSQESETFDTLSPPEAETSETQVLAGTTEELEKQDTAIQTAGVQWTWIKWVFVYLPLVLVALIVLGFTLLFAIDWSQETFHFCEIDAESAQGTDEMFSCASFVKTLSLVKFTLRETALQIEEVVQSYIN